MLRTRKTIALLEKLLNYRFSANDFSNHLLFVIFQCLTKHRQKDPQEVASLRGESSNQLLETLEEWNEYLEHLRPPMPHSRYDHNISKSLESNQ
jgi:hypothetical protein